MTYCMHNSDDCMLPFASMRMRTIERDECTSLYDILTRENFVTFLTCHEMDRVLVCRTFGGDEMWLCRFSIALFLPLRESH